MTPVMLFRIVYGCLLTTAGATKFAAALEIKIEIDPAFIGVKFDPVYIPGLF